MIHQKKYRFNIIFIMPSIMKRSMSDNSNMCTKCSKLFHKGWQMFHHKKICKGIRERRISVPTNQEEGQHDKEPQVEQDQDEGVHEDRDPGAALDLPVTSNASHRAGYTATYVAK